MSDLKIVKLRMTEAQRNSINNQLIAFGVFYENGRAKKSWGMFGNPVLHKNEFRFVITNEDEHDKLEKSVKEIMGLEK